MDNTESSYTGETPVASSLGSRLRKARDKANLSIEDISTHLRLTCQVVQDIESDDYSRVKRHLVFLRGYLRAYAKLVDLPPDEVIETFNQMNVSDVPIQKPSWQTEEALEIERAERSNWLAFIVLSSLLVVGVISWWYAQHYGFSNISQYISQSASNLSQRVSASTSTKHVEHSTHTIQTGSVASTAKKTASAERVIDSEDAAQKVETDPGKGEWLANQLSHLAEETMTVKPSSSKDQHI